MGKVAEQFLVDLLAKYAIDPNVALWDCHGTWVMYHRYCELIAEKAGIHFFAPTVMHHDPEKKRVVLLVRGSLGPEGRSEWSFGEVAPENNKNSYPWAMAEKRAKDRVILKLAGLAGHVYSEEESEDFRPASKAPAPSSEPRPPADAEKGTSGRSGTITEKQAKYLHVLCARKTSDKTATESWVLTKFQVTRFRDIPYEMGQQLIDEMAGRPDVEQGEPSQEEQRPPVDTETPCPKCGLTFEAGCVCLPF